MQQPHKYARVERERRFLLNRFPCSDVVRLRQITDRYIDGTCLRLREQTDDGGPTIYKLTQKIPQPAKGVQQGRITTIHLTEVEFRLLAQLPAKTLSKVRYSVPPFGIDVFEGVLEGLRVAEAEFNTGAEAAALIVPDFILHEGTDDDRFTGGAARPRIAGECRGVAGGIWNDAPRSPSTSFTAMSETLPTDGSAQSEANSLGTGIGETNARQLLRKRQTSPQCHL